MAELKEKLFSEFAPVSTEEWMAKITADLKGVHRGFKDYRVSSR